MGEKVVITPLKILLMEHPKWRSLHRPECGHLIALLYSSLTTPGAGSHSPVLKVIGPAFTLLLPERSLNSIIFMVEQIAILLLYHDYQEEISSAIDRILYSAISVYSSTRDCF